MIFEVQGGVGLVLGIVNEPDVEHARQEARRLYGAKARRLVHRTSWPVDGINGSKRAEGAGSK